MKSVNNLTTKHMFGLSEKLISEQSDEIYGVNTINSDECKWKHLSLVMKKSSMPRIQRLTYFRFCIVFWKDEREPTINLCIGKTD